MIHYILQTLAFQLLFLLVYDLFLKKETFFNYNRAYLLITPLLSLILPLIQITAIKENIPPQYYVELPAVMLGEIMVNGNNASESTAVTPFFSWMWFWYLGVAVSALVFGFKLFKLLKLKISGRKLDLEGVKIVTVANTNSAFTFLNYVFLGESLSEDQKSNILLHEKVHVKHKHTLDLLYFEILRIVFWFNPLVYIFQKRITALQEYVADAEVAKLKERKTYYQELLSEVFQTQKISFINTFFNHSLIKKRILMLQKSKSKKILQLKYLLLLPIVGAMLVYTSCSQETETKTPNSISEEIASLKSLIDSKGELSQEEKGELAAFILDIYPKDAKGISSEDHRLTYQTNDEYWNSKNGTKTPLPFSDLDKAPIYPGCEDVSEEDTRRCFQSKISNFIQENFKIENLKDSDISGKQKIVARFTITKDGSIVVNAIKTNHPDLEAEALWTIGHLPDMIPGEKDGKKVDVQYAVPIMFDLKE